MMSKASSLLLLLGLSSFGNAQTVTDIIKGSEEHEILLDLVERLRLDLLLSAPALNSTLFAPTNDAFAFAIPDKFLEERYQAHLAEIVGYHLTGGMVKSTDLTTLNQQLLMHSGDYTTITSVAPDPIMINDATITQADLVATNGIVHVVDEVLLPEFVNTDMVDYLVQDPDLTILNSLLEMASLTEALQTPGPFTLLAPSDEAFANLGNETLTHLLSPEGVMDLQFILSYHVVVGVNLQGLEESTLETATGTAVTLSPPPPMMMMDGPMNITNMTDAVKNMTGSIVQNMTSNVVPPKYATINNGEASIVVKDILVQNGVIHIIDSVLAPPDSYLAKVAADAAAAAADVADTVTDAVGDAVDAAASSVPPVGVGSVPPGVGSAPPGGATPPGPPDGSPGPLPGGGPPDLSAVTERRPPGDSP